MSKHLQYIRIFLTYALCFLALSTLTQASDKTALFEEALIFNEPASTGHALRSRSVIITDSLLTGSNTLQQQSSSLPSSDSIPNPDEDSTSPVAKSLRLNLFDNLVVDAKLTNAYQNRSGSRTWVGEIETGVTKGTAAFVVRNGEMYGVIDIPGEGNFSIRPGTYSSHIIEEIDNNSILTGESDAVIAETIESASSDNIQTSNFTASDVVTDSASVAISNDDGSIIDVYIGYDQDASGGSVTPATAQSLAELFIAYTNKAYENSGINQRVWLVGDVDGFNYTSGTQTNDLSNVKNGSISGLHAKRDEHHADLVMFFRPFANQSSCSGLAYLQTTNGDINWQANGFSVMQACTFGSTVFAHELGHNMGSRHDWYMDASTTPQTYAHGYIDTINNFRTIMSYSDRCTALGISCDRVAHFSNPLRNYNNHLTGVPGGTSSGCTVADANPAGECDADNTRNFNEKASTTAQFRESKVLWTGAVDSNWENASNWSINVGAPGSTTIDNQIPRSYDNVLIPTGLSNYPVISGNADARELTIDSGATLSMTGGTLTVGWAWEDAGGFNASAGTVKLVGPLDITLTSSSTFYNLEIGSGSDTTQANLDSNLDINGSFTVKAGATFNAGSHQINIAGDFDDAGSGFDKGTGTVVFDGVSQTIDKTTTSNLLSEDFSTYTSCGCTSSTPSGWARSGDGSAFLFGNGNAYHWHDSTDAWLFTKAVELIPGTNYTLAFDYLKGNSSTSSIDIKYGASQLSSAMSVNLGSVANTDMNSSFQSKQISFTVPVTGTYYIGFNSKQTSHYNKLDNIVLNGTSLLQFHNLKVSVGNTEFLKSVEVTNNFETFSGGVANLGFNNITVEGTVTNNSEIKQSKATVAGTSTSFVSITNKAGSDDKYYGLEINPTTTLGNTTVSVKGNQVCSSGNGFVLRCYNITPTTSGTATIKFYHRSSELNGNSAPIIKTPSGSTWSAASSTASRGGSGDANWVSSGGLTASGAFGLDDFISNDTTPDAFSFAPATGVALSSVQTSNSITVGGINAATSISVTGGTYSINGGAYTNTAGTVTNGQTVTVRHTASGVPSTNTDTVLTIGGVSSTYRSTTVATDTTPTAFSFTAVTGVALSSVQTSNSITVGGINAATAISVANGTYSINGGAYTSTAGTVTNGQTVTVRHTASGVPSTNTDTVLTIGGVSSTYRSTTVATDTTPAAFSFTAVTGVALSSVQTSNSITVGGINAATAISVANGTYSINGGAYTSTAGTVTNGQTVTVRHTASGVPSTNTDTVLTIGGVSSTYRSTTIATDTTPTAFSFTAVTGVALSSVQTSNSITVGGINAATAISVANGTYSINGGAYTSTAGTVTNGQTVTVRHTASGVPSTNTDTVLTIGGVSSTYRSTTVATDTTPTAFSFTAVTGVALSSVQTSNSITVGGINAATAISVANGTYSINGGAYTSTAGTVTNGQTVTVRHTASGVPSTNTDTVLTIGGVSSTYRSTTVATDTTPTAFSFTAVTGVALSSVQTSNSITVGGINAATAISVANGTYSINGGAYTSTAGTVTNGQTVTVRHTASGVPSTNTDTVLTIGGVSSTYRSTTVATDTTPTAFSFTAVTGVALSSVQTSNSTTVGGINAATAISVANGTYSINGGAYTSTAGTVTNGQTVTVRHTASGVPSTNTDTVLTIGGVSSTYRSTTIATDTTPTAFSFTAVTGVALSSVQTSNSITVGGINAATAISVANGTYSINGGAYTSTAGTVTNGQTVTVRHTASGVPSTNTDTVLTIGGVSSTYRSTTVATDTTPTAFSFTAVTGVALSSVQTSNSITVGGINAATAISVANGTYSINGGAYTSTAGTVTNGQTVTVRHTASGVPSTNTDTVLTIGGVSSTYRSTTVATDTTPTAFSFTAVTGVALSSVQTSNSITVGGINAATAISVANGTYSINGGAYTSTAGTVTNGQTVTVRHTASGVPSTNTDTVLTIGGVSSTYRSTTVATDTTPTAFSFTAVTGVALSSVQTSNSTTVGGINAATAISVANGTYSINGGAYTSTAGTVTNGQTVTVRHTASGVPSTNTDTVLTIGGVSSTYRSTTVATDTTPTAFSFTAVTGVALSSVQTSNSTTIGGINAATSISVTGGTYSINGGQYVSTTGSITNGQTVTVRHTASGIPNTGTDTVLSIGSRNATYRSTTSPNPIVIPDGAPDAFSFTPATGVALGSVQTSTSITISGINIATPISVINGSYSIDGGVYVTTAGTITNDQAVTIRHNASATLGTNTDTTLTIGNISSIYRSTTVVSDTTPNAFSFAPVTDVAMSTAQTSDSITVSGINTATTISITNGTYSIDGEAYTSTSGTINNGQTVTVRHTAADTPSTSIVTELTIGGIQEAYTSTTVSADITPDTFSFPALRNVIILSGSQVQSNSITISGLSSTAPISVINGEYSINGGDFSNQASVAQDGDVIVLRQTASDFIGGITTTTLTLGTFSTDFVSTTTDQAIIGIEASTNGGGSIDWLDLLLALTLLIFPAAKKISTRGVQV